MASCLFAAVEVYLALRRAYKFKMPCLAPSGGDRFMADFGNKSSQIGFSFCVGVVLDETAGISAVRPALAAATED